MANFISFGQSFFAKCNEISQMEISIWLIIFRETAKREKISKMTISIWLIIFRQTAKGNEMKSPKSGIPISLSAGQDVHGLRPDQQNHVPLTNCRPAPILQKSFQPFFNKMLGPTPPPPPPHTHTVGCDVLTYVVDSKSTGITRLDPAGRPHFRARLDLGAACCRHGMP